MKQSRAKRRDKTRRQANLQKVRGILKYGLPNPPIASLIEGKPDTPKGDNEP